MSELETLIPQPVPVEIAGETLLLTPVVIGEIPKLLKAITPFTGALISDPDWIGLLSEHGEAVLDALAICSRKPRPWIDALTLDEAVRLFQAVFEATADIFVQRVAPAIQQASQVITEQVAHVSAQTQASSGPTPSPA